MKWPDRSRHKIGDSQTNESDSSHIIKGYWGMPSYTFYQDIIHSHDHVAGQAESRVKCTNYVMKTYPVESCVDT
jgi:hypothetical protein